MKRITTHLSYPPYLSKSATIGYKQQYFSALFTALLITPLLAYAANPNAEPVKSVLVNFHTLLTVVIQILITLAFVVFGWGIIKLITAGGDTKKIADAKGILTYGIIGLFVLSSMYGILVLIKTYLGVPDNTPIIVPEFQ